MASYEKRQLGVQIECPLCHQMIDHVEIRRSKDVDWLFDYDCPRCEPWIFRDPSNKLSAEAVLDRIERYGPEAREHESRAPVLCYVVARLTGVVWTEPPIVEYLEKVDATLQPFGGKFIIHGGLIERIEGAWTGDLIVIQFASRENALGWYRSADYQAIANLRLENSQGDVILVDGVDDNHRATDVLSRSPKVAN